MTTHDAIFIGAGQAGPFLAAAMAEKGKHVALIERKFLGGTCVNAGCMPTKTLVASARAAHVARRAGDFGVRFEGPVQVDMGTVAARARQVTMNARQGLESWLGGMKTLELIHGQAQFTAEKVVRVGERELSAPLIFINVGARPVLPDYPGLAQVDHLTSTSIIALDRLPEHLVIIGGSYIGLEFAQMYRRFGAKVTVVERGDHLASREDEDISEAIEGILRDEGIGVVTQAQGLQFSRGENGVKVSIAGHEPILASHILLATGRTPNTDDLGLAAAGIDTDDRGFITVDDKLMTNVNGVYALGDCNGHGAFTHTSYNDFEIVAENLLHGGDRRLSSRILGYALYIDPPLGRAGLSEAQARAKGHDVLVSTRPMSRVGRATERDETKGFMKIVADAETKQILGAAFLGIEGDEAIHGIIDMMHARVPYDEYRWAMPIHPTVSELIPTLLQGLKAG